MKNAFCLALVLAACGGGDEDPPADSPSGSDGSSSAIEVVTPCTGESATVTAGTADSGPYMQMATTISVGQTVKFVMPSIHDVAPRTAADDAGLRVGFGQTKCLKFTTAGTFNFKCSPHGFVGAITVN